MRKKISAELKAKVAIESIKGLKTISEIASMYEVHPNQMSIWKKQYMESAVSIFSKPNPAEKPSVYSKVERVVIISFKEITSIPCFTGQPCLTGATI